MGAEKLLAYGLLGFGVYKLLEGTGAIAPLQCPDATRNPALNVANRDNAASKHFYGPEDPSRPSVAFWARLAKTWASKLPGTFPGGLRDIQAAMESRCDNCGHFDVSPTMQRCLKGAGSLDAYDRIASSQGARFGYCWKLHFRAATDRTCLLWKTGGPIRENADSPMSLQSKAKELVMGAREELT